ncbi:MAG: hypothetical protein P8X68_07045 [Desulfobacterales bacterium]|jgi:hypothetical protein
MARNNHRRMRRFNFFAFWALLIGALYVFPASCSYRGTIDKTTRTVTETTQKIRRTIRFSDDDLKRIAVLASFENRSLYQDEDFAQRFRAGIPEYLNKKCDSVAVLDPGVGEDFKLLKDLPRLPSGEVDNFALAENARALGINAVIIGSLDDIGLVNETEGLIFKEHAHFIQILVRIEVYDTETGTKIVDDSFNRRVQVDQLDYDMMRSEGKLKLSDLDQTLNDLLGEMGERICWAIEDQPWNGFITSIAGNKVVLSAGSNVGLKPGDEFEVFDNSRIIKGRDGQRFLVHGPKKGRIRIVAVQPHASEATAVSNKGIKTGNSVRVK